MAVKMMAEAQRRSIEIRGWYLPKRYILTFLGFFGMFNLYAMRITLSVAIVAMVNSTDSNTESQGNRTVECPMLVEPEEHMPNVEYKGEQYNWDAVTQGMILGAFYYGYAITQIPGGILAEKYGSKHLFGVSVLLSSVCTLLTPLAASIGVAALIVLGILKGLVEGVPCPVINTIISTWSPVLERSRTSSIIFMGGQMGNIVSLTISGWLCSTAFLGGWPSAFYVFGIMSCVWFLLWLFLIYESPSVHPTISETELSCFEKSDKALNLKTKSPIPWKAIFTSMSVWAICVAQVGDTMGFLLYITEMPNYLSSILHFNVEEVGMINALMYVAQTLTGCFASWIADKLRASGKLSITTIRKIFNAIGMANPGICLLCITVSGCQRMLIIGLLILAIGLNGFVYSGYHIINVDMAPELAGTLYGIANTYANLCGFIVTAMVGFFISEGAAIPAWNKVFVITAVTYIFGAIFFNLFASAELQPWKNGTVKKEYPEPDVAKMKNIIQ